MRDCTNAQADLNHRWAHVIRTFSDVAAHIGTFSDVVAIEGNGGVEISSDIFRIFQVLKLN